MKANAVSVSCSFHIKAVRGGCGPGGGTHALPTSKNTPQRLMIPSASSPLGQGMRQELGGGVSARAQPDPHPTWATQRAPLLRFTAVGLTAAPLEHPQRRELPRPSPAL